MERLFDVHAAGRYDLIIIDTPPTRNAIDFLEAPKRMADFFGGRPLRWLPIPYRMGGRRGARGVHVAPRALFPPPPPTPCRPVPPDTTRVFLSLPSQSRRV